MADSAVARKAPHYHNASISQTHRDITDERYRDLRRARKVRFFCNGDRYFKGKVTHITPHRYLTFNDLLSDLTGKLPTTIQLPYGVRSIYTPVGGHKVRDIEELQDGQAYVCAGFESFKPLKYGGHSLEPWSTVKDYKGRTHNHDNDVFRDPFHQNYGYGKNYYGGFHPGRSLRKKGGSYGPLMGARPGYGQYWTGAGAPNDASMMSMKPKVITVVRNGPKPRNNVKILLNRRSVQSYEQLMKDISEAFGPKWKNNRLRKLFSIRGREVNGVSDFFRDDDVFIGVGNESLSTGDVQEILEELYPDSPYAKNLMKEWEKTKKRLQAQQGQQYKLKAVKEAQKGDEASKKDSGLGSDDSARDDNDDLQSQKSNKKSRRAPEEDFAARLEKERIRYAEIERERARKRMQKKLDSERKSQEDEERRKKLKEDREAERRLALEQERARREEEREAAEEREREKAKRMARRPSDDTPKVIVVVKGDQEQGATSPRKTPRKDRESPSRVKTSESKKPPPPPQEDEEVIVEVIEKPKPEKEKTPVVLDINANKVKKEEPPPKKEKTPPPKKEKTPPPPKKEKTPEPEKKEPPKEDDKKKKQKTKIVKKTKMERQISNAEHVTNKYEPGRTLGDGNFAIVKSCKQKGTPHEYAMKIVDKAKLKGKEQMIENEIEIMKKCVHPNIVKLYEEYETKPEIYLIMELVKGGDLFDAITQSIKFDEKTSAGMVTDLTQALFYLHSQHIVHRDLKPENLLVLRNKDSSISIKLADFGLAMEVKEPIYTVCGTPTYVAPEILTEVGYGLEVDMWATGVISYILLCGFPPFRSPDRNQTELFEFIKAGEFEFLSPYWDKISRAAKDLITRLLVVDKRKRYTAIDVLCHPWIFTHGGAQPPPENIDDFRKNKRKDLESQAKQLREAYVKAEQSSAA